jgi:hypothetical protein
MAVTKLQPGELEFTLEPVRVVVSQRLTPEKAKELLRHNNYRGQRPLKQARLAGLAYKIERGTFRAATVGLALVASSGKQFMVNGQHCCHAVLRTGKSIKLIIEYYEVPNDHALALLYSETDNQQKRNTTDTLLPFIIDTELQVVPMRCIRLAADALYQYSLVKVGKWATRGAAELTGEQRASYLYADTEKVFMLHELLFGEKMNRLFGFMLRSPVLVAILSTHAVASKEAIDFWTQVRDGEMLKPKSPQLYLRDWLLRVSLSGPNARIVPESATKREVYARCIGAWNYMRQHKPMPQSGYRYRPDEPIPKTR